MSRQLLCDVEDLKPEFKNLSLIDIEFQHFTEDVQDLIFACGGGIMKINGNGKAIYPPQVHSPLLIANLEQINNPQKDRCPQCGKECSMSCRCLESHRSCPNGHWWRRNADGSAKPASGVHPF